MGPARSHRPHISDVGQAQRQLKHRDVELRIMGEHTDHRVLVDFASLGLGGEIPVGPVDDHFVGRWKTCVSGELRAGIADGNPVAENEPCRAKAAAKSMAPNTSILGRGA